MRSSAVIFILVPLIVFMGITSCEQKPKEYAPLKETQLERILKDSSDVADIRFFHFSLINERDHVRIWSTLADTNCPISTTIKEVNNCKQIPKYYQRNLHAFLTQIALAEYSRPLGNTDNEDSVIQENKRYYALRKIVIKLDSLYDQNIIYDCMMEGATFSKEYIFLENFDLYEVSHLFWGTYEIQKWHLEGDTVVFNRNDSTQFRLIEEDGYLRTHDDNFYHYKFRRPSKSYLIKKPLHFENLSEQGH